MADHFSLTGRERIEGRGYFKPRLLNFLIPALGVEFFGDILFDQKFQN